MEDVNTILFIETILSEGCIYIKEVVDEETQIRTGFYLSINQNKRVAICVSDETTTARVAKEYLRQLGLVDLIERMF